MRQTLLLRVMPAERPCKALLVAEELEALAETEGLQELQLPVEPVERLVRPEPGVSYI